MRWNPFSGPRAPLPLWKWATVYAAAMALSCWCISSCTSDGVVRRSDDAAASEPAEWVPPAGATLVGADTCAGCHEEQTKALGETFHGKTADPRTPMSKDGCETCHGPGSVHAEAGGGKGTILAFGGDKQLAGARNATCLQCHEKTRPLWKFAKHAARDVSCTDCHSVHKGSHRNAQLKSDFEPEVCAQCHKNVNADLDRQAHHPIREGKVKCSDCHNPHGSPTDKNLNAETPNQLCYKCHTEKRGPFLWGHPPVEESCLNCHQPHGSIHEKLLVMRLPYLCQRCHSASRHPATVYDRATYTGGPALSARGGVDNGCLNCHAMIHGSNHPSGDYFHR